jgi:hypothetical protein
MTDSGAISNSFAAAAMSSGTWATPIQKQCISKQLSPPKSSVPGRPEIDSPTSAPMGIVADIEKDWGPQSAVFIPTKRARGKILSYY